MRQYSLKEFLDFAHPFVENETMTQFKEKLVLVPDAQQKFSELLLHDPLWFAAAMRSLDSEEHFHVFFHTKDEFLHPWETNKTATIALKMFDMGTKPVIVVTRFVTNPPKARVWELKNWVEKSPLSFCIRNYEKLHFL